MTSREMTVAALYKALGAPAITKGWPVLLASAERQQLAEQLADELAREEDAAPTATAELLPKADVVAWLVKKSREEKSWDAAVLASKVARGAVRPDNLRTLPADFFQPGHTYRLGDRHTFRCTSVDHNPGTDERHAIGWAYDTHTGRWRVTDLTSVNWRGGWTDVTEAGDGRG